MEPTVHTMKLAETRHLRVTSECIRMKSGEAIRGKQVKPNWDCLPVAYRQQNNKNKKPFRNLLSVNYFNMVSAVGLEPTTP